MNVPHHRENMNAVLFKVLDVAVLDPDANIRQCALMSLAASPLLDPFNAQDDCLNSLFCCLHDEQYVHRELALTIIARITQRNPSVTLPRQSATLAQHFEPIPTVLNGFFLPYPNRSQLLPVALLSHAVLAGCLLPAGLIYGQTGAVAQHQWGAQLLPACCLLASQSSTA